MSLLAFLVFLLLSIQYQTLWLDKVRSKLDMLPALFYRVTDIPQGVSDSMKDRLMSRQQLLEENRTLRDRVRIQEARLQKMASLFTENVRLRQLINSSKLLDERFLGATLIGVSPDPLEHKIILNKGSVDGVYVGQPLLDAYGLMGQVVSVAPYTSQVLLITDNTHAIPVRVTRNDIRTVVEGVGDLYNMRLRYISPTTDIRVGDVLVSSGLGGRFPVGYPVAQVESIEHVNGEAFMSVVVKPTAQLDRARQVLLVFKDSDFMNRSIDGLD